MALRDRHAEYYHDFARVATSEMEGPHQVEAGRRFAAEHENLLGAISSRIDRGDVDLALGLLAASATTSSVGYALRLPTDTLGLDDTSEHPLYPFGLAIAASEAAARGDRMDAERLCEEAVAAERRLGGDPERLVDEWVAAARQQLAMSVGSIPRSCPIRRRRGRDRPGDGPARGARTRTRCRGDLVHDDRRSRHQRAVATEGLAVARRFGNSTYLGLNLAWFAGALADTDPDHATTLLHENIQRWDSLDYEHAAEITNATLISARIRDWPTALELAPHTIRHLHWTGERPQLAGILNILARVLAPNDPESAAVIQGAARRLHDHGARTRRLHPRRSRSVTRPTRPPNSPRPRRIRRRTPARNHRPALHRARRRTPTARYAKATRWTPTKSPPTRSTPPHKQPPSRQQRPESQRRAARPQDPAHRTFTPPRQAAPITHL